MIDTLQVVLDPGATMPTRAHKSDAGLDLYPIQSIEAPRYSSLTVDTGVHIAIPHGYTGLVLPRSSISRDYYIAPGVIDSGYTGSIKIVICNFDEPAYSSIRVYKHTALAQLLILPCELPSLIQVTKLSETERGNNGFGSTNKCQQNTRLKSLEETSKSTLAIHING